MKEYQPVKKAIWNKGFSCVSSILPCIKIGLGGQETNPKSLTAYNFVDLFIKIIM